MDEFDKMILGIDPVEATKYFIFEERNNNNIKLDTFFSKRYENAYIQILSNKGSNQVAV